MPVYLKLNLHLIRYVKEVDTAHLYRHSSFQFKIMEYAVLQDPPPDPLNYTLLSLDGIPSTPALARTSCDLPKGLSRVASLQKQHETLSFSQVGSCVTASQCDKSATISPLTVPASQSNWSATVSPREASNYHLLQSSPCLVSTKKDCSSVLVPFVWSFYRLAEITQKIV